MGREVVVVVSDGRLDFGPWEQIFSARRYGWHASLMDAVASGCWSN